MWPWDAYMGHTLRLTLRSTTVEGVLTDYMMNANGDTLQVTLTVEGNPNPVKVPWGAVEYWEDLTTGTTNPADVQGG